MRDDPVYRLTLLQRVMILITVVLSTVLVSSASLPQLQGAQSVT